jgi:hypothetical protein
VRQSGGGTAVSEELKAKAMAECDATGASVAMAGGINANVVHR